jgi:hypothetical protein
MGKSWGRWEMHTFYCPMADCFKYGNELLRSEVTAEQLFKKDPAPSSESNIQYTFQVQVLVCLVRGP